jgi:predicted MFS family arabinose efflux permease
LQGLAGPLAHQALAMNTSSNFLGVSLGAAVGGIVISVADATTIPLVAATFGIFALLLLLVAPRSPVAA